MTYSEFVKIYPALDLFLELFKGLGPTLIAILAIVLNHRNSVKRDKENRRNSLYYTVQKEMLDPVLDVSQSVFTVRSGDTIVFDVTSNGSVAQI